MPNGFFSSKYLRSTYLFLQKCPSFNSHTTYQPLIRAKYNTILQNEKIETEKNSSTYFCNSWVSLPHPQKSKDLYSPEYRSNRFLRYSCLCPICLTIENACEIHPSHPRTLLLHVRTPVSKIEELLALSNPFCSSSPPCIRHCPRNRGSFFCIM